MLTLRDKKSHQNPLRQTTLCFLLRETEILLAMKKRGFGVGKWNGVGGKPMIDETIIDAAIRETEEEIGVTPVSLKNVATLNFYFPQHAKFKDWDQQVVVFFIDKWTGEPKETEEVKPQWFPLHDIPFSKMWPDDLHWLPKTLRGEFVHGDFYFNEREEIEKFEFEEEK